MSWSTFFHSLTRSDCSIRLVTNILLMISDLDCILGYLFLYELTKYFQSVKYIVFGITLIIGQCTYFAGVLWLGPQQRWRVVSQVKELMQQYPDQFRSTKGSGRKDPVGVETPVYPSGTGAGVTKHFSELEDTSEDYMVFQAGMEAWGLLPIWNYAKQKNARNVTLIHHGVPFYRLARFGFFSRPNPSDLGGILNANALYSFANGIFQIAFGVAFMLEFGTNAEALIPMGISVLSLILTCFNIFFDFSAILESIDQERMLTENFLRESQIKLEDSIKAERTALDTQLAAIKAKYQGKPDIAIAEEEKDMKKANHSYEMKVSQLNQANLRQLQTELNFHNHRVESIKELVKGKPQHLDNMIGDQEIQSHKQTVQKFDEKLADVERKRCEDVARLDITALSASQLRQQMEQIEKDADERISVLARQKERFVNKAVAGVPSTSQASHAADDELHGDPVV